MEQDQTTNEKNTLFPSTALEASFSSSQVPNGIKLHAETLTKGARPKQVPLSEYYELPRVVAEIAAHGSRNIALQFPEALLGDAAAVVWELESLLEDLDELEHPAGGGGGSGGSGGGASPPPPPPPSLNPPHVVFVLGDTSYGEASVDEVAAAHLPTDLIVHFGPSTLSGSAGRVPVVNVFGGRPVDAAQTAHAIHAKLVLSAAQQQGGQHQGQEPVPPPAHALPPLVLVFDAVYLAGAAAVASELEKLLPKVVVRLGTPPPHPLKREEEEGGGKSSSPFAVATGGVGDAEREATALATGKGADDGCCRGASNCGTLERNRQEESKGRGSGGRGQLGARGVLRIGGLELDLSSAVREKAWAKRAVDALLPPPPDSVTATAVAVANAETRQVEKGGAHEEDDEDGDEVGDKDGDEDGEAELLEAALATHAVVFLGGDGWLLTSVLLRCNACATCLVCDPYDAEPCDAEPCDAEPCKGGGGGGGGGEAPTTEVATTTTTTPARRGKEGRGIVCRDARSVSSDLRRRYYLIERTKDATVIGVVVGTLGAAGYREMLDSTVRKIRSAGRRPYLLALGTPNVPKLTNFAEVDAFVLIASQETSLLLDSRDFPVPVLTPFELDVALGLRSWDGRYSADFADLKEEEQSSTRQPPQRTSRNGDKGDSDQGGDGGDNDDTADNDAPRFSLVTSSLVPQAKRPLSPPPLPPPSSSPLSSSPPPPSNQVTGAKKPTSKSGGAGLVLSFEQETQHAGEKSTTPPPLSSPPLSSSASALVNGDTAAAANPSSSSSSSGSSRALTTYHSPAAEFLATRSYQGLERRLGLDSAHLAVAGKSGTASGYQGERPEGADEKTTKDKGQRRCHPQEENDQSGLGSSVSGGDDGDDCGKAHSERASAMGRAAEDLRKSEQEKVSEAAVGAKEEEDEDEIDAIGDLAVQFLAGFEDSDDDDDDDDDANAPEISSK